MKRILWWACALFSVSAYGYNLSGVRWSGPQVVMDVQLGTDSVTLIDGNTSWGAVAEDAVAAWNSALFGIKFWIMRDSQATRIALNAINNVFFSPSVYGDAWPSRTLAVTISYYTGSPRRFIESDVLFNNNLVWNSYRGALRTGMHDFRRVALHEFGHVLGLNHPDDVGQSVLAVMNSTASATDGLQPDDVGGARVIYEGGFGVFAPAILTHPSSQTVREGQSVTFSVTAISQTSLNYQWRKDGNAISGATGSTYTIASVAANDSGSYSVSVSNSAGTLTSGLATLTVNIPPTILTQPASQTVTVGQPVTFSVTANGIAPLSYQWRKNGAAISGATSTTYTIASATASDGGSYTVTVSNTAGEVVSNAATLIVNTAPTIVAQPAGQTMLAGQSITFTVTANGTAPLSYQWRKDGVAIAGATNTSLTITNLTSTDTASYDVIVSNAIGSVTSAAGFLTVWPASVLSNLSIRATMSTGQTLIVGAVVSGGTKNILVRAAGPALNAFGLKGMADPRLEIYSGPTLTASNDDWPSELASVFRSVGAFPFDVGSRDAAIYRALNGGFTVQSSGSGSGTLLVEAYDSSTAGSPRLVNLSARNRVGPGDDVLIAGFAVSGTGTKTLLIRAVGPTLASFGVTGALADPMLRIVDSKGVTLASNDDWSASLADTFTQVAAFPLIPASKDSAVVVNLNAGATYTVLVSGAGSSTGEAMLEIYELF